MRESNNEIWRAVKGYDGYAVSNLGRVKSVERTCKGRWGNQHIREKILKPAKNCNGYLVVGLCKNGVTKTYLVHRLVAEAFIPNPCPEKYDIVNHKIEGDEGKLINTVDNLEWCDTAYNDNYGTRNERISKVMTNGKRSKTVYQYTLAGELVKEWPSVNEVRRQTGWSQACICACCNGKQKTAHGFVWSYTGL